MSERKKPVRVGSGRSAAAPEPIAAAQFKARCLELMDRVRETGAEFVITWHGEPLAKLVPYTAPVRTRLYVSMKDTVLEFERPLEPLDDEWDFSR